MGNEELAELQRLLQAQNQAAVNKAPTMFVQEGNDNLIRWQLDIKEELERMEHLLRKHVPKIDGHGNLYYEEPPEADRLFNERGVNEILNLLSWYLSKTIFLSNFNSEEIQLRCEQFSYYLSDFIFNNYQSFGLDSKEKIKHYPIVVMNIVNIVEAAYNRALGAGERESLRTARSVVQQEPLMAQQGYPMMNQNKSKSILKPWTWGR